MPTNEPRVVERTYSWRGQPTGYRTANSWIPDDPRNRDFSELEAQLINGTATAIDPAITSAIETLNRRGQVIGHLTNLGFIPADPNNRLNQLLEDARAAGSVSIQQARQEQHDPNRRFESLIHIIALDRPVGPAPYFAATTTNTIRLRSHPEARETELTATLRNTFSERPYGAFDSARERYGLDNAPNFGPRIAVGVVEIEVAVAQLRRVFQNESRFIHPAIQQFLGDLVEQRLAMTGRTANEGPDIEWLIRNSRYYMSRMLTSATNSLLAGFAYWYGGSSAPHVREPDLFREILVLGRRRSGEVELVEIQYQHTGGLPDVPGLASAIETMSEGRVIPERQTDFVLRRVKHLRDDGFIMESVSLLNSVLERTIRRALVAAADNEEVRGRIMILPYRRLVETLATIRERATERTFNLDGFDEFLANVEQVRRHRNDYLHGLTLPDGHLGETADLQRMIFGLTEYFLDPFWQMNRIAILTDLFRASNETRALLLELFPNSESDKCWTKCARFARALWTRLFRK